MVINNDRLLLSFHTCIRVGKSHLHNKRLLDGRESVLSIGVSSDSGRAILGLSAAVLKRQLDRVGGFAQLDDELGEENEEVRAVDLVAVGLVDRLHNRVDRGSWLYQPSASLSVSDASICSHQIGLGQIQVHRIVERHAESSSEKIGQALLVVGEVGDGGFVSCQYICIGSGDTRFSVDHLSAGVLGTDWVVVSGVAVWSSTNNTTAATNTTTTPTTTSNR